MANEQEETEIILNWCYESVQAMMQTMTLTQSKSLARRVKDFTMGSGKKNQGADNIMMGGSHCDLDMVKSQESIDSNMDKIRGIIIDKTMESD